MRCKERGCSKPRKACGLCAMHYWRLNKYGTTADRPPRTRTVIPCRIAGCDNQAKRIKLELCVTHYERWKRYGDPLGGGLPRDLEREEYFWPKVNKRGPLARPQRLGRCWDWTASTNRKGYGTFAVGNGRTITAHRYAYELLVGPIPKGMQIDHLCRNHACVNPKHLEAVTQLENQRRGDTFATRNARKTHCVNGHRLSPSNSYGYNGRRQCKKCAQARAREQYAVNRDEYNAKRRAARRGIQRAGSAEANPAV